MIRKATERDAAALAELALLLWENHDPAELQKEFTDILHAEEAACFLADKAGFPIGFAQCQLRHDYVEGTHTSPVGYLEGVFVRPEFRNQGVAKELLTACEQWAGKQGCTEFASDCELKNEASLNFHLKLGFAEANRVICFTKRLYEET